MPELGLKLHQRRNGRAPCGLGAGEMAKGDPQQKDDIGELMILNDHIYIIHIYIYIWELCVYLYIQITIHIYIYIYTHTHTYIYMKLCGIIVTI